MSQAGIPRVVIDVTWEREENLSNPYVSSYVYKFSDPLLDVVDLKQGILRLRPTLVRVSTIEPSFMRLDHLKNGRFSNRVSDME